jgi:4-diphosphocytidyl-2-C-methyl-D-erythritol kinase
MICFPNCKINLGLSVTKKRTDGFHNLETVIYPIKLHDVLEIIVAPDNQFTFTSTGINIIGEYTDNLVVQAYNLLQAKHQLPPVKIHLHKIIPIVAGLGGGSSDAAFTINTLNNLFNLGLSHSAMQEYARKLGADCAFFIENKPVMATQKGDQFEPINLNLRNYFFTIIKPNIQISTPEAYSWIKPKLKKPLLRDIINQPIENWRISLKNDFEDEVFRRYPEIKQLKDKLYQLGALYAAMSGSGSAVFGIFKEPVSLENKFQHHFSWTGVGI